jgi:RNA polymerase sigma-54 factor
MQLAPRMLQSIEVLQLAAFELGTYLERAALENEALELIAVPSDGAAERAAERRTGAARRDATERHDEWLQNQPQRAKGLAELCEEQLALMSLDDGLDAWVRFVVASLDASGYLSTGDERLLELAAEAGLVPDVERLGRAIAVVQSLEPRGIGGRDAVEALLLQLDPAHPDYALLCRLLEDFLDELSRNKLPVVARALGIDLVRLEELLTELRVLEPRPLAADAACEAAPVIVPEVVVERRPEGGFEVRVEGSGLPAVAVDAEVASLARARTQPVEVRRYLRDNVERARWIVDAVEQRRLTRTRIAVRHYERQQAFVEEGPAALVPLAMQDLAAELEVSTSTVSRTVAGKHAQTPWGVFALRHFFQASSGGSGEVALDRVRDAVRELVAAEDPERPLSDDELVRALAGRGIQVARRTVAKYRSELAIPSSYRRRRHV